MVWMDTVFGEYEHPDECVECHLIDEYYLVFDVIHRFGPRNPIAEYILTIEDGEITGLVWRREIGGM